MAKGISARNDPAVICWLSKILQDERVVVDEKLKRTVLRIVALLFIDIVLFEYFTGVMKYFIFSCG